MGKRDASRGASLRIAIADDSPAFAAAAAEYLAGMPGYVLAWTAQTDGQMLALLRSSRPDILLFGLGPVPARGLETLRRIKTVPGAPTIIALTLFHSPEAAMAARGAGAAALVGKEAFVSSLTQVLERLFPVEIAA